MLSEDELRDAALLVFANKQDQPGAKGAGEISEALKLGELKDRNWTIVACSAIDGSGVNEGMDWLVVSSPTAKYHQHQLLTHPAGHCCERELIINTVSIHGVASGRLRRPVCIGIDAASAMEGTQRPALSYGGNTKFHHMPELLMIPALYTSTRDSGELQLLVRQIHPPHIPSLHRIYICRRGRSILLPRPDVARPQPAFSPIHTVYIVAQ